MDFFDSTLKDLSFGRDHSSLARNKALTKRKIFKKKYRENSLKSLQKTDHRLPSKIDDFHETLVNELNSYLGTKLSEDCIADNLISWILSRSEPVGARAACDSSAVNTCACYQGRPYDGI